MNKVKSRQEQAEQVAERDVVLSAAEREVLRRVQAKAARQRDPAWKRFGKYPPTFFWWWMW